MNSVIECASEIARCNGDHLLGIKLTDEQRKRKKICEGCEHLKGMLFKHCKLCGCPYKAKIRTNKQECQCPLSKWEVKNG